ncbi:MAG: hypothetical protein WCK46_03430 [Candidatus Adlerbacteria bacterium]
MSEQLDLDREGVEHLKHIEEEVTEIKKRTPGSWRAFSNGVMQGMGAIVGGVLAVILLGWILSIFGVLPGLNVVVPYIQNAIAQLRR